MHQRVVEETNTAGNYEARNTQAVYVTPFELLDVKGLKLLFLHKPAVPNI